MHIAQIAPLTESVPPRLYGGTERIVSFLTEELVAMGHDVTLFASGGIPSREETAKQAEIGREPALLVCSPASAKTKTFVGVIWPMFGPFLAVGLVELVAEADVEDDAVHAGCP